MSRTASPEAKTSARYDPKVRRPVVSGRAAIRVATRAAPRATTSAAMWPASLSSASEPLDQRRRPARRRRTRRRARTPTRSRQRWVAPGVRWPCPCSRSTVVLTVPPPPPTRMPAPVRCRHREARCRTRRRSCPDATRRRRAARHTVPCMPGSDPTATTRAERRVLDALDEAELVEHPRRAGPGPERHGHRRRGRPPAHRRPLVRGGRARGRPLAARPRRAAGRPRVPGHGGAAGRGARCRRHGIRRGGAGPGAPGSRRRRARRRPRELAWRQSRSRRASRTGCCTAGAPAT